MTFFRNFLLIYFSLFIIYIPLKSMEQKSLKTGLFETKIFIFPYTVVNSKIQLFGGSKNLNSWKPFETKISTVGMKTLKKFILNLKSEAAKSLHYQTLGLFAHYEIKLQNALDLEHGINYFLHKFENEQVYYLSKHLDIAIFFIKVPYINNSKFNCQQQKFLEKIEKSKKRKNDYSEFFKKNVFDWISIDEIYQNYNDDNLTKATKDSLFKDLVSTIKSNSLINLVIGIDSNEIF